MRQHTIVGGGWPQQQAERSQLLWVLLSWLGVDRWIVPFVWQGRCEVDRRRLSGAVGFITDVPR